MTNEQKSEILFGGDTLAQAWRAAQAPGRPPKVCLLSSEETRVSGEGISALVLVLGHDLVRFVCTVVNYSTSEGALLFVFNGDAGHVIYALSADPGDSGITFYDPRADSLLSKRGNAVGVDAERVGNRWHLTSAELERVIIAAFVRPATWAVLNGQPGGLTVRDLHESYFGRYFDIIARDNSDPAQVLITLRPDALGFGEHAVMQIWHNEKDEIYSVVLRIRQSFIGKPSFNFDSSSAIVLYHLLTELVPLADKAAMKPLADELRSLHRAEFWAKVQRPEYANSETGRFALAFLGVDEQEFGKFGALSFLTVRTNKDSNDTPLTEIILTLD